MEYKRSGGMIATSALDAYEVTIGIMTGSGALIGLITSQVTIVLAHRK
jgi:hypothetical protein